MDLLMKIKNNNLVESFIKGNIGLEKEGLRTKQLATLAHTPHPQTLGDRKNHPYIVTDYGESQPEIITPPLSPYIHAHRVLKSLNYILIKSLPLNEYIWPFSVPCNLPAEGDIKISHTDDLELLNYRRYTASKYGKKRQMITGIHINYSFSVEFLERLYENQVEFKTISTLQDALYLKLASNFLRYQWILVYLYGATPIAIDNFFDGPFFKNKILPIKPMRSLRNSEFGFNNEPRVNVRYDNLVNYVNDLQDAISTGLLAKEREYYGDIRLRGTSSRSIDLLETGINYIEVRSFDNNPFHATGLSADTLQFIHLFFLTMVCLSKTMTPAETEKGEILTELVASEHPYSKTVMYEEGIWLLDQMNQVAEILELDETYFMLIKNARNLLNHPEKTTAGVLTHIFENDMSLLDLGELLGTHHKNKLLATKNVPGFEHLSIQNQQHLISILLAGMKIPHEYFVGKEDIQMDVS